MEHRDIKEIGYKAGYLLSLTLVVCLNIAIIALTTKLLMWLF